MSDHWRERNKQGLLSEVDAVYRLVRQASAREPDPGPPPPAADYPAARLDDLCALFQLTPFARRLIVLCAGVELDSRLSPACAEAQGAPALTAPTFGLALAALPEPDWGSLLPAAPLRRWRLIELGAGASLMQSPLRLDERVLHYLLGYAQIDERIAGLAVLVHPEPALVASHQAIVEAVVAVWSRERAGGPLPIVQLCGDDVGAKRAIAAQACAQLGLTLTALPVDTIPAGSAELGNFTRLWEREAALAESGLLIDGDAAEGDAALRMAERLGGVVLLAGLERRRSAQRPIVTFDIQKPGSEEQRSLWRAALGEQATTLNGQVDHLVAQFHLGAQAIASVSAEVLGRATPAEDLGGALWEGCRGYARPRLDDLAQRIDTAVAWDDLVLPEPQLRTLREVAAHVRQRMRVYHDWGMGSRHGRGLGISALFAGVSGTGKTLAAEVLANTLRLDLYRIDLSSVVSKYIGETEKNLRRIFDAAEEGGAILLFDEADALFGKRSEVKDSHDRYANIEVSYLLQRMEQYRGLAILTTNLKHAIDPAFFRRIRFLIQFPFPDVAQRAAIWRRMFPAQMPLADIDYDRLGQLSVPGGNIRNIALRAAFLAADADTSVAMNHLLDAARSEYMKIEKALTDTETYGWALPGQQPS